MSNSSCGLQPLETVTGQAVQVPGNDLDTDRIVPARFLRCLTFDGLGPYAFFDDRQYLAGNHPLDLYPQASILVAEDNFGCGSSREHAPQALYHWGIRCLIAKSFAEIFFGNATVIGIPCLTVSEEGHSQLVDRIRRYPDRDVTVDLSGPSVEGIALGMPEAVRQSFLAGEWDPLAHLLANRDKVEAVAKALPYTSW